MYVCMYVCMYVWYEVKVLVAEIWRYTLEVSHHVCMEIFIIRIFLIYQ